MGGTTTGRDRRRKSIRKKLSGTREKPRLSVFRANKNMHCQVIDDTNGITIASASTLEKEFKILSGVTKTEASRKLGEAIARRAVEKGVSEIVFDRSGYKYHGRVKALAESARENGLKF
ncbi:MAG: 50S ribosomal protein L18 [Actinobacteria bacterium]|nr:50S ribosomal protein L18 [Actinomycetota bacterium]